MLKSLLCIFLGLIFAAGFSDEESKIPDPWKEVSTYHVAVHTNGNSLILDDGSIWSIGWLWGYTVEKWEVGDEIQLVIPTDLSLYMHRFNNLTKRESAWARRVQKQPDIFTSHCRWIQDIQRIPEGDHITLNSGLTFCLNPTLTKYSRDWQIGDILTCIKACWPLGHPAVINHTRDPLLILGIFKTIGPNH